MDNDESLAADDARLHGRSRKPRSPMPASVEPRDLHNRLAAVASSADAATEATPLLGDRPAGAYGGDPPDDADLAYDFSHLKWYQRPSIYWMLGPFALFALSYGGTLVPKLNLILAMVCREYLADEEIVSPGFSPILILKGESNPECRIPAVQSRVADFQLYANIIGGVLAAIVSPRLGALSDSYGRKKVIILTMCGTIIGELIAVIVAYHVETFPSRVLLLGYAIDGICGSFTTAMAITHSYATDCTPPKLRGVVFGYFHACLFTGIAVGPVLAGLLAKLSGSLASIFLAAAIIQVGIVLFLAFVVPESLTKARQFAARERRHAASLLRSTFDLRQLNPFPHLKILWPTNDGSRGRIRRNLVILAAIDTFMFGIAIGSGPVVIYYAEYQFGWETFESSIYLSVVCFCRVFWLLMVLPLASRLLRGKPSANLQKNTGADNFDLNAIRFAIFMEVLGTAGFSVVRTGALFTLFAAIASAGGIASPTLQSALTRHVNREQTGQVMGATGLLHALARVVGPTILNAVYRSTVDKFAQAIFVCLAGTFALAFVVSWFLMPHVYTEEGASPEPETRPSDAESETEPILSRT